MCREMGGIKNVVKRSGRELREGTVISIKGVKAVEIAESLSLRRKPARVIACPDG